MAVLGLIDPLGLRCGLIRLATKRLSNGNAGSGDYSGLEQNALGNGSTSGSKAISWRRQCRHSSQILRSRPAAPARQPKPSTKKNFLSGRPGEENPQRIFTGRMDAKSPLSHRQNQTNFRSAPAATRVFAVTCSKSHLPFLAERRFSLQSCAPRSPRDLDLTKERSRRFPPEEVVSRVFCL